MSPTSRQISENVVVLLHRLALNQTDLARRTGMSRMVLSQRINGRNEWRADEIDALASALGVSAQELMTTLPDLKEWDRRREQPAPEVGVRAAGEPRFLVMPDQDFAGLTPPSRLAKPTSDIMSDCANRAPPRGRCHWPFPSAATKVGPMASPSELVSVRYLVDDVDEAVTFYTTHLGFTLNTNVAPAFADVVRGSLRLLLSGSASSGARATPPDRSGSPGRNRINLPVDDLEAEIDRLAAAGLSFVSDLVSGPGGSQILVEDPSGNLVELFQPRPT